MMDATTAEFLKYAAEIREEVNEELATYATFGDGCPERLEAAIRHSLMAPCKRLRPLLVLSAAETCGLTRRTAMPAACAIEMVHTYSLVHDDLPAMDDDDLRRGLPSCHAAFDEATAILAGDALLTRAFEIIARDQKPTSTAIQCVTELARAAGSCGMVGGQADDLAAEFQAGDVEFLTSIHRRKTGAMLTCCLRLGAISAGGTSEQIESLTTYGGKLGLAFQIVDDLLDITGAEAQIGKKTNQDTEHGKLTFPSILGIEESRQRAEKLIEEAIASLNSFGSRASNLEALAHYVLNRNH